MPRTCIVLTDKQLSSLRKIVKETGIRLSELVRRIVDEYLARQK